MDPNEYEYNEKYIFKKYEIDKNGSKEMGFGSKSDSRAFSVGKGSECEYRLQTNFYIFSECFSNLYSLNKFVCVCLQIINNCHCIVLQNKIKRKRYYNKYYSQEKLGFIIKQFSASKNIKKQIISFVPER